MGATLDALHVLQLVELKLTALRSKIGVKKRAVRSHEKKLAHFEEEISAKHLVIQQQQSRMDQLELDINSRDDEVTKLRLALNNAKTNKEYAAILTQGYASSKSRLKKPSWRECRKLCSRSISISISLSVRPTTSHLLVIDS